MGTIGPLLTIGDLNLGPVLTPVVVLPLFHVLAHGQHPTTTRPPCQVETGLIPYNSEVRVGELVFACHSKACAPPPVGTGGSLKVRGQSVVRAKVAPTILKEGFKIGNAYLARHWGDGVYFGFAGDEESRRFYSVLKGGDTTTILADLDLKNPLKISGRNEVELQKDLTEKLGGAEKVMAMAQERIDFVEKTVMSAFEKHFKDDNPEGWEKFMKKYQASPGNIEGISIWAFSEDARNRANADIAKAGITEFGHLYKLREIAQNSYSRVTKPSELHAPNVIPSLSNMARDQGYDSLIIESDEYGWVGGPTIVVFDTSRIKIDGVAASAAVIAACYSKECAPPPVGTGGSKPGTGARGSGLPPHAIRPDMMETDIPGLWKSPVYGKGRVLYVMEGQKSGEWLRAYAGPGSKSYTPEMIARALNQIDSMVAFQPLPVTPALSIGDMTEASNGLIPAGVGGMVANPMTKESKALEAAGFVVGAEMIFLNSNPRTLQEIQGGKAFDKNFLMPSFTTENAIEYMVAHEYGHQRLFQKVDSVYEARDAYSDSEMRFPAYAGLSKYGAMNHVEAHAEAWAHYVMSGYTGDGGNSVYTSIMAGIMGWDEAKERSMTAAASDEKDKGEIPLIIMDNFVTGKSVIRYADDEEEDAPKKKKTLADVR